MPYVSLDNLARFHGRLRDRASSEFASLDMANWQRTAAAGAVSFSPVPEMPLDPVVNFLFSETGPASGTKGPDNPSTITGKTQFRLWRTGKNLIPPKTAATTINGVTFTPNPNGSITVTGTPTGRAELRWSIYRKSGVTYSLSGCPAGGANATYFMASYGGAIYDYGEGTSFTTPAGYYDVSIIVKQDADLTGGKVFWPQLEIASAPTAFEPYDGTDYIIGLGGTFYGGSVDLSTGVMTVTHFCTNVNTFYQFTEARTNCILVRFRCDYYSGESSDLVSYVCDLFPSSRDTSDFEHVRQNNSSAVSATLYLAKSRLDLSGAANPSVPTDAEWLAAANAWVAEHPFDFVSMLKNPYTAQLTSTQIYSLSQPDLYNPRINTVYSDQVSVQVGYPKSPQATQNELTSAVVSLGGNV